MIDLSAYGRLDQKLGLRGQLASRLFALWMASAILGLVSLSTACSGGQVAKLNKQVSTLREDVAELRRGQAAQRVQFDSFRNRLVMLQDHLDSQQVAARRRGVPHDVRLGGRSLPLAEPPKSMRQVVLRPPRVTSPSSPPPSFAIGPDGVPQQVKSSAVQKNTLVHKPLKKSKLARSTRRKPAGPSAASKNRPPGDRPSRDELAAGAYRKAKALLDAGRLREARQEFGVFLKVHPHHSLSDNALYWMGETWYAQAMWLKAARSFGEVVGRYPNGNKVPDAMLKTGLCYRKVGEEGLATEVLKQLRDLYPGTSAARIAAANLTQMGGTP